MQQALEPKEAVYKPTGGAEEEFVVTEEIYAKTFDEIEAFIRTLDKIIRDKNYEVWVTYLSEEYIKKTSDPDYLKEQSEKPILKKNNILLEDLEDYFYHVVVPSRSQTQLYDIEFIDGSHVKAISIIRNRRGLLYLLIRIDNKWKMGVW